MIHEPPNSNQTALAPSSSAPSSSAPSSSAPSSSAPSSSAPSSFSSSSFSESERDVALRDRNHNIDDELESQLADLRGSFDGRADELRRRTTRFRAALDVATRIRERPLAAMGIGAAVGGAVALVRPMGRASSSLVVMVASRVVRFFALQLAERIYSEVMHPQIARDDEASEPEWR